MAFIKLIFSIFSLAMLITMIVSFIMIMKFTIVQHRLNFRKKQYIKKSFPKLTKKDLKYRQIKIFNYQQLYLNSGLKHNLQMTALIGSFIGMIAMFIIAFFTKDVNLSFVLLSLTFCLISIFILTQPSLKERNSFWNDYLEEHPDNPLNVCSFPLDLDEKAYENERKLGVYSLIFAVSLFVVSFIGN
ncbi:hypothetical protein [Enterococcus hirae]|uniref:hypothetical protein n=1 Tax=Enterococcus TaxID=1350 RepID=UPI0004D3861B|nr:hypothetical protein [Enterococcus hirae]EMF0156236.1 hypothetical protein [Enterococcus hirae]KDR92761.1 hypothetical protein EI18_09805 [Enterococcus hirae]MBA5259359.1 hypothetical protein [Enterococcus hirae]MBA5279396.1 hypothetical protein [Enterococcus hirae]MCO5491063.1 hypothetical protein [Enterococcus hirae]